MQMVSATPPMAMQVAIGYGKSAMTFTIFTPPLVPIPIAKETIAEQSFTVQGLKLGDVVVVANAPGFVPNLGLLGARVAAADTLAISWCNLDNKPNTPTAGVYQVLSVRSA